MTSLPGDGVASAGDADDDADGAAAEEYSVEACLEQIEGYQVEEPAPEWLPDRLLVHLVTLPNVVRMLRRGLDRAKGEEKLQLITTGLRRKGEVDPVTAGGWPDGAGSPPTGGGACSSRRSTQYLEWGEGIDDEDLPELRRAPDTFWLKHENDYHPEAMVLWGIQLGADAEPLRAVAQEAVATIDEEEVQQTVTVQEQLRHQVDALSAEVTELRHQLDERGTTVRAREQRIAELTAEVETLRAAERRAGSSGEQLAEAQQQARDAA